MELLFFQFEVLFSEGNTRLICTHIFHCIIFQFFEHCTSQHSQTVTHYHSMPQPLFQCFIHTLFVCPLLSDDITKKFHNQIKKCQIRQLLSLTREKYLRQIQNYIIQLWVTTKNRRRISTLDLPYKDVINVTPNQDQDPRLFIIQIDHV